jgi:hypothetical protein
MVAAALVDVVVEAWGPLLLFVVVGFWLRERWRGREGGGCVAGHANRRNTDRASSGEEASTDRVGPYSHVLEGHEALGLRRGGAAAR